MTTVADVLRRHGRAYLERFGDSMPSEQKRALKAIMACRSGELGGVRYQCGSCGRTHVMGRSCGNRHSPSCQSGKAAKWCRRQLDNLLPCHNFLVTFTAPKKFRQFARRFPNEAYAAMFRASSDAIKTLAADPRRLGATASIGFFGVLQTWGRDLNYHPHVHYVVLGGGIDKGGAGARRPTISSCPANSFHSLPRGTARGLG